MSKTTIGTDSVFIGGKEYVPIDNNKPFVNTEGLPYVCIRTHSAGVHFGYLSKKESTLAGVEVELLEAQRMRFWEGAMDLSQLSTEGSKKPSECRPSVKVPTISLVAIEIIPVSSMAKNQIDNMKIWKS